VFKFPSVEPDIEIVDLPGESFEVVCRGLKTFFVMLELGAEDEFSFYDYPKDGPEGGPLVLSGAQRERVTRRIKVDDFEMFEVESWYAEAGSDYSISDGYANHIIREGSLREIVSIETPDHGSWVYKAGTSTGIPHLFRPGMRVEGTDPTLVTGKEPDKLADWLLEVTGAAQVSISTKSYRCLKVLWAIYHADQPCLAEFYVADTGRTVFFRRYDGPESFRYDKLAGHPTVEFEGKVWRHFYDSIPSHALIIGL
jgi:hypothetical protein